MRLGDLVGLALFALRRHKARTLLTTLGVLFGTMVLVVSLALRQGVQDTVLRQAAQYVELWRIEVQPRRGTPAEPPAVPGKMSDERRRRLSQQLRYRQPSGPPPIDKRLTPETLARFAEIPHVVRAEPVIQHHGRAFLGDKGDYAHAVGVPRELLARARENLLVGDVPGEGDLEGAAVSEVLLYQLGIVDEEEQRQVLGRSLTFEVREGSRPRPTFLLSMLLGGLSDRVDTGQEKVLAKVLERLPQSLDRLGLTAAEQRAMREMLRPLQANPAPQPAVQATYRIIGIMGAPKEGGSRRRDDWVVEQASLVISPAAAEAFFHRRPEARELGYDTAIVEVDDIEHVKEVSAELRGLGFSTRSALEFIEREQFIYLLVFTVMSVVALVALMVSSIGIANTMLMSVLERFREIGIFKATGARDGHVLALFLMEGALVGLVGGLLGLALARGIAYPSDAYFGRMVEERLSIKLTGSLFAFSWPLLVGAPALAAGLATLAAYFPARRAVRIDPVKALRHE